MTVLPDVFKVLRALPLALFALSPTGCGDDGDGGNGGGSITAALQEARSSLGEVCDVTQRCYPELQEDGFCGYPDSGGSSAFEEGWPPAVADSCWDPLYKAHPDAVIEFLDCLKQANKAFAACLTSCPDDQGAGDCGSKDDDNNDACELALMDVTGEAALEEYDSCEKSKRPDDGL
jgi:hypothetical protein